MRGKLEELWRTWRATRDPVDRLRIRHFAGAACHAEQFDSPIRVVHLTDLHVGRVTPMALQYGAVEASNALKPDIVVLTGDFICHSQVYLDDLQDIVSRFQAPVYAVLGNHDHWGGAAKVRKRLRRAGAEILDNAWTKIQVRHQDLQIVGLDDAHTGHADRRRALLNIDPKLPLLGLSHIGEEADGLWAAGVPLVLSGHTHAGQIAVGRLSELSFGSLVGHKYVHGLYGRRKPDEHYAGAVYVGAGLGSSVFPIRFGERARPEITLFELGARPDALQEDHEEQEAQRGRKPSEFTQARRRAKVLRKARKRRSREGE